MRILFDQGTPVPLRRSLNDHLVATAYELLITTDTNLCYQQNLTGRRIGNSCADDNPLAPDSAVH